MPITITPYAYTQCVDFEIPLVNIMKGSWELYEFDGVLMCRHHHNGKWEARIGRVFGNKYLYLGTYGNFYTLLLLLKLHNINKSG